MADGPVRRRQIHPRPAPRAPAPGKGCLVAGIDGDVRRTGLTRDLGFSAADCRENVRRAAEAAFPLADAGVETIAALISPFRADRADVAARARARRIPFAENDVAAPLAASEQRDPKGLDRRARAGLLAMIVLATLCGVMRGQRNLAAFASGLSQAHLRALRWRKGRDGRDQSPKEATFYRILTTVDAALDGRVLREWAEASLGPSADTLVASDGKAQGGAPRLQSAGGFLRWVGGAVELARDNGPERSLRPP